MAENFPDTNVENIEYISKQDASDWLKQYGQDVLHGKYKFSLMYIWKNVMDLHSADVVQVVRCRKCKYFRTYRCMDSMPIETCELAQTFYNPDLDFCSLAKRREE